MARNQYILWKYENIKTHEKQIRKFLLGNSDTVRLTECQWTEFGFFKIRKHGGKQDEKFASTLNMLKPFFKKKITDNKKYNDVGQGKRKFTHYFYKLSPKLKALLNKETLLWNEAFFSKNFYGFEDPTFYKKDVMIGSIITHEPLVILHLTESEKKKLEKQKVKCD